MSSQQDDINTRLLAVVEQASVLPVTLDNITNSDLWDYAKKQIKDNYQKPRRISGRVEDDDDKDKQYRAPLGLFNLGNNSMFYKDLKKQEKVKEASLKDIETLGDEEQDVEIKNNVKMGPDGKLFFVEEDQGDKDAGEEQLEFNLTVKNDLPWQIYKKIYEFGRLTIEELYAMYGAIEKPMFLIVVNDMINKRYLKKVKETDQIVEFNDDAKDLKDFTKVTEREIETLEVVTENERRQVLSSS